MRSFQLSAEGSINRNYLGQFSNCDGLSRMRVASDLTVLMPRLIWAFAGTTAILVFKCQNNWSNSSDFHQTASLTASEEAVWSKSSLFAVLTSILWTPALIHNILFENRKRKVFEILDHLLYPGPLGATPFSSLTLIQIRPRRQLSCIFFLRCKDNCNFAPKSLWQLNCYWSKWQL